MASTDTPVRVRFAPSPTGLLHIGGLRTALYNYLVARKHHGSLILRIEDTDRERFVEEAEADILTAMDWTGLQYDEGPVPGGPHAPYRQSERSARYQAHAQALIEAGRAYYAFDTPDELQAMRERLQAAGEAAPTYNARTRLSMRNGLSLSPEETQQLLKDGVPYVVRLLVEPGRTVRFEDAVRGWVTFETDEVDDQVLLKSDGMPTYHLANVVDDHEMDVTHVIRGEEWLPSTPKHMLIYEALGWEPPRMAHLPLILSPNGGKLSKRNAEKMGIPVNVWEYREAGYEPEALVNFLAFLGWNPGTEEEVFDLEGLVEAFSLERVGSAGVQFNLDKLRWYNEQHLRRLSVDELAERARPYVEAEGYHPDTNYLRTVTSLMQERISLASDIAREATYFFQPPDSYDEKAVKKRWKDDSATLLTAYADRLEAEDTFTEASTEAMLRTLAEEREVGAGRIIHPTRLALSGVSYGPSLFAMMVALGKAACVERLRAAVDTLG